jgi:transcriptional regulator with XRE-family HTH domain
VTKSHLAQLTEDPREMRIFQQERLAVEITELMCKTMKEQGVKRSQLARLLDKTKGRVSQILNGETNLTIRTVADIFTVLGKTLTVSGEDLFVPKAPLHFISVELVREWSTTPSYRYEMDDAVLETGTTNNQLVG